MVQKKIPPVIKWNPYKDGETRSIINKELNLLVAKKDHRRKVGLETGALREFKGNTHWNLFVAIELAEVMTKRLNGDLKSLFFQTSQGINNTNNYLTNISQQLKKVEFNLGNATTLAGNNAIKAIRAEVGKLDKLITDMDKMQQDIKATTDKIQTDMEYTANVLKESITENSQKLLKELCDRNEASQMIITEDIHNLQNVIKEKINEINVLVQEKVTGLNEQVATIDNKNSEQNKELTKMITKIDEELSSSKEQLTTFQDATNNMFDDQQNALITEFQEGIGGLMKQNLDNLKKIEKLDTSQKNDIIGRIDESTENITSIIEATNSHMDKINEQIGDNLKETEKGIDKEFKKEIADVRSILSTIRSDIELMKSVLTKLDSKVH